MSLLASQMAFRDAIAAPDDTGPPLTPGMAIYREAYRGRLLAALEQSFERTRRWVGAETFTAAACHHVISHPPHDWTLDTYGAGFPAVLEQLFAGDPEVAELAWLEWHLQQAFAAPDRPTLDAAELAARGYGPDEWAGLRVTMAAGFAARPVATGCVALWEALAAGEVTGLAVPTGVQQALLVWRVGVSPHYRLATPAEYHALLGLAQGQTLAAIATAEVADEIGPWLAQWLSEGMFATAA